MEHHDDTLDVIIHFLQRYPQECRLSTLLSQNKDVFQFFQRLFIPHTSLFVFKATVGDTGDTNTDKGDVNDSNYINSLDADDDAIHNELTDDADDDAIDNEPTEGADKDAIDNEASLDANDEGTDNESIEGVIENESTEGADDDAIDNELLEGAIEHHSSDDAKIKATDSEILGFSKWLENPTSFWRDPANHFKLSEEDNYHDRHSLQILLEYAVAKKLEVQHHILQYRFVCILVFQVFIHFHPRSESRASPNSVAEFIKQAGMSSKHIPACHNIITGGRRRIEFCRELQPQSEDVDYGPLLYADISDYIWDSSSSLRYAKYAETLSELKTSGIVEWSTKSGAQDTARAILESYRQSIWPNKYIAYEVGPGKRKGDAAWTELQDDVTSRRKRHQATQPSNDVAFLARIDRGVEVTPCPENTAQTSDLRHDSIHSSRELSQSHEAVSDGSPAAAPTLRNGEEYLGLLAQAASEAFDPNEVEFAHFHDPPAWPAVDAEVEFTSTHFYDAHRYESMANSGEGFGINSLFLLGRRGHALA